MFLVDAVTGTASARGGAVRSIHGDALSYMIGAACIVAKVASATATWWNWTRKYPMYGFARNKGYGTAEHIAALKKPTARARRIAAHSSESL